MYVFCHCTDVSDRFFLKTYCHISKAVAFVSQRTFCLISFNLVFLWYLSFRDHWNPVVHRAQSVQVWVTAIESTPTLQEQLSFSELVFFLCYYDIQNHLYESCFPLEKNMSFMMDLTSNFTAASIWWPWRLAGKPICFLKLSLKKKVIWLADWLKLPMSKVRTCCFSGKNITVGKREKRRSFIHFLKAS